MPQRIDVPGQGIVEFPDGMSDVDMAEAIRRNFFPNQKPPEPPTISAGQFFDQLAAEFGQITGHPPQYQNNDPAVVDQSPDRAQLEAEGTYNPPPVQQTQAPTTWGQPQQQQSSLTPALDGLQRQEPDTPPISTLTPLPVQAAQPQTIFPQPTQGEREAAVRTRLAQLPPTPQHPGWDATPAEMQRYQQDLSGYHEQLKAAGVQPIELVNFDPLTQPPVKAMGAALDYTVKAVRSTGQDAMNLLIAAERYPENLMALSEGKPLPVDMQTHEMQGLAGMVSRFGQAVPDVVYRTMLARGLSAAGMSHAISQGVAFSATPEGIDPRMAAVMTMIGPVGDLGAKMAAIAINAPVRGMATIAPGLVDETGKRIAARVLEQFEGQPIIRNLAAQKAVEEIIGRGGLTTAFYTVSQLPEIMKLPREDRWQAMRDSVAFGLAFSLVSIPGVVDPGTPSGAVMDLMKRVRVLYPGASHYANTGEPVVNPVPTPEAPVTPTEIVPTEATTETSPTPQAPVVNDQSIVPATVTPPTVPPSTPVTPIPGRGKIDLIAEAKKRKAIQQAAADVNPAPTEAQKEAGNYQKGHVVVDGMDISIENAKGSTRNGVDSNGTPWSVMMPANYGYIKGTVGKDKDHLDIYLGDHPESPNVFVVDQSNPDGKFDEHKILYGFPSRDAALSTYDAAFSDGKGPQRRASVTTLTKDQFKDWLKNGDHSNPLSIQPQPQESNATPTIDQRASIPEQYPVGDQSGQTSKTGGGDSIQRPPPKPEQTTPTGSSAAPSLMPVEKPVVANAPTDKESLSVAQTPSRKLADWIAGKLEKKENFDWRELFENADTAWGGTQAEGKYTPKDAYDAMELGINRHILAHPEQYDLSRNPNAVTNLKELISRVPTQTRRTTEQDEFQQFSTPPPMAAVVGWVANIRPSDTVVEPSAGIGGIAVFAKMAGANVVVNELSPRRRAVVSEMGFDRVFGENAEQLHNVLPKDVRPTVVLMNPPFSASAGRMHGVRRTQFGSQHIDQALARLEPGGRLVAIVGEGMAFGKSAFTNWWNDTKAKYNVRANIGVDGGEYSKYGTSFGVQILVIDKTGPTTEAPLSGSVRHTEDLIPLLEKIRNERQSDQTTPDRSTATGRTGDAVKSGAVESGKPAVVAGGKAEGGSQPTARVPTGVLGDAIPGSNERPAGRPPVGPVEQPKPETPDGLHRSGGLEQPGRGSPESGTPVGNSTGVQPSGSEPVSGGRVEPETVGVGVKESTSEHSPDTAMKESQVFENYHPQVFIPGAISHPTPLAESAAMASVRYPAPSYKATIPADVLSSGKISDAQFENVALAGQAHESMLNNGERRGYFVGDGTGVGKGRTIAAIILDNWNKGRRKGIWVSKSAPLFKDAQRDLGDIGFDPERLFSVSKIKAGAAINAKEGIAFTTYATLRSAEKKDGGQKRLEQIAKWLGKDFDGLIVFDEAHELANAQDEKGTIGKKKASQKALAGVELQQLLPNARVVYVSATGATEVSNLAYANRLGLWGDGTPFARVSDFTSKVGAGGVAAMEVVAKDLKQLGLYMARSLSFDGVEQKRLEHKLTGPQIQLYDRMATAWQVVLQNFEQALEATGGNRDGHAKSAARGQFWGAHQRFFNTLVTSLQTPSLIESVKADIARGESSVIQLVNTNEATQERGMARVSDDPEATLDDVDMTPRDVIIQLVEASFPTQQYEPFIDDKGNEKMRPVKDSEGNPVRNAEAVAMKERLLNELASLNIPKGALDLIIDAFGPDAVAEITGRKRRIVERDGKKVIEKRGKNANAADLAAFRETRKRVLAFSDAGGTGASYHADKKYPNQQKRNHYVLQPGWRADNALQGTGRSHRSNQAQPPLFILVTTDLNGQKRFTSTIARRLEQLGALTKGQRQTTSKGLFDAKDNLESSYAKEALKTFLKDVADNKVPDVSQANFETQTGLMLVNEDGTFVGDKIQIGQFLNRLLSMKVGEQNKVFDAFWSKLGQVIDFHTANGTLDVGMETLMALKTKVAKEQHLWTDDRTGAETKLVEIEQELPTKVTPWSDAKRFVEIGGKIGVNVRSGQVWVLSPERTRMMATGEEQRYVTAKNPQGTTQTLTPEKVSTDTFHFVTGPDAEAAWQRGIDQVPKTYKQNTNLITGTILPVWDRLGQVKRIARAQTDDGKRLLGVVVEPSAVPTVLGRFGVDSEISYTPKQAVDALMDRGQTLTLANDWKLMRRNVSGGDRIEILGPSFENHHELERLGVMMERHNFKMRYFIPTGDRAADIVGKITKSRPIVAASGADVQPKFSVPQDLFLDIGDRRIKLSRREADPDIPRKIRALQVFIDETWGSSGGGTRVQGVEPDLYDPGTASWIGMGGSVRQALEKVFGRDIVFVDAGAGSEDRFSGVTIRSVPDAVFLNVRANDSALFVAGHELLHQLRNSHPDLYNYLSDGIKELVQDFPKYRQRLDETYDRIGVKRLNNDTAFEELMADFMGDNFRKQDFWEKLYAKDPTHFQKFVNWFRAFVDWVKGLFKNYRSDQFFTNISKAQDVASEVMAEFSKRDVRPPEPGEGELKFSLPPVTSKRGLRERTASTNLMEPSDREWVNLTLWGENHASVSGAEKDFKALPPEVQEQLPFIGGRLDAMNAAAKNVGTTTLPTGTLLNVADNLATTPYERAALVWPATVNIIDLNESVRGMAGDVAKEGEALKELVQSEAARESREKLLQGASELINQERGRLLSQRDAARLSRNDVSESKANSRLAYLQNLDEAVANVVGAVAGSTPEAMLKDKATTTKDVMDNFRKVRSGLSIGAALDVVDTTIAMMDRSPDLPQRLRAIRIPAETAKVVAARQQLDNRRKALDFAQKWMASPDFRENYQQAVELTDSMQKIVHQDEQTGELVFVNPSNPEQKHVLRRGFTDEIYRQNTDALLEAAGWYDEYANSDGADPLLRAAAENQRNLIYTTYLDQQNNPKSGKLTIGPLNPFQGLIRGLGGLLHTPEHGLDMAAGHEAKMAGMALQNFSTARTLVIDAHEQNRYQASIATVQAAKDHNLPPDVWEREVANEILSRGQYVGDVPLKVGDMVRGHRVTKLDLSAVKAQVDYVNALRNAAAIIEHTETGKHTPVRTSDRVGNVSFTRMPQAPTAMTVPQRLLPIGIRFADDWNKILGEHMLKGHRQDVLTDLLERVEYFEPAVIGHVESFTNPYYAADIKSPFKGAYIDLHRAHDNTGEQQIGSVGELVDKIVASQGDLDPKDQWSPDDIHKQVLKEIGHAVGLFSADERSGEKLFDQDDNQLKVISAENFMNRPRGKRLLPRGFYEYTAGFDEEQRKIEYDILTVFAQRYLNALEDLKRGLQDEVASMRKVIEKDKSKTEGEIRQEQIDGKRLLNFGEAQELQTTITREMAKFERFVNQLPSENRTWKRAWQLGRSTISNMLLQNPATMIGNYFGPVFERSALEQTVLSSGNGVLMKLPGVREATMTLANSVAHFQSSVRGLAGIIARNAGWTDASRMLDAKSGLFGFVWQLFGDYFQRAGADIERLERLGIVDTGTLVRNFKSHTGFFKGGGRLFRSPRRASQQVFDALSSGLGLINEVGIFNLALPRALGSPLVDTLNNVLALRTATSMVDRLSGFAMRAMDARHAVGLDPNTTVLTPAEVYGMKGATAQDLAQLRSLFKKAGINLDRAVIEFWQSKANGDQKPLLTESQMDSLITQIAQVINKGSHANRPIAEDDVMRGMSLFWGYTVGQNARMAKRFAEHSRDASGLLSRSPRVFHQAIGLILMAALLGLATAPLIVWLKRKLLRQESTVKLPTEAESLEELGKITVQDMAQYTPLIGKFFLTAVGSAVPGTKLGSFGLSFVPVSMAQSIAQTVSKSWQTGSAMPFVDFLRRWNPNSAIVLNRLPAFEGKANESAARNVLVAHAPPGVDVVAGTKPASGMNYSSASAQVDQVVNELSRTNGGDMNAIREYRQAGIERLVTAGKSQADAAEAFDRAVMARDPYRQVFGRDLTQPERSTLMASLSDDQRENLKRVEAGRQAYANAFGLSAPDFVKDDKGSGGAPMPKVIGARRGALGGGSGGTGVGLGGFGGGLGASRESSSGLGGGGTSGGGTSSGGTRMRGVRRGGVGSRIRRGGMRSVRLKSSGGGFRGVRLARV